MSKYYLKRTNIFVEEWVKTFNTFKGLIRLRVGVNQFKV